MARDPAEVIDDSRRGVIHAVLAGAAAVMLAGTPLLFTYDFGPLSQHMSVHIATMNVVAPIAAALLVAGHGVRECAPRILWIVATVQMLALWLLHTPRFHHLAAQAPAAGFAIHALLTCLALLFWLAILNLCRTQRWHAPAVLLLTGKLACLLAALLIFSPRLLYAVHHGGHGQHEIADQQLAGLLMIVACPLSYLTAAVLLTLGLVGPHAVEASRPAGPRHAP